MPGFPESPMDVTEEPHGFPFIKVLKLQELGMCSVPFGKAGQEWSVESRFAPTFPRFGLGGPGHSEENEEALRASSEK
ncbi:uncharacterized protein [Nothobranchius furzeri]|uniref:Uncharacterized protein n=1 Tax=Nothobranchius furzeri TaxID=105023 RepID=A0A1A8AEH5_NOTFU